jgi:hypothetical protein
MFRNIIQQFHTKVKMTHYIHQEKLFCAMYLTSSNFFFALLFLILDRIEWLEQNPSNLCANPQTFLTFFTRTTNKYDINLNRIHSSINLHMRLNATQAKKMKHECKFTISTKHFNKNAGIYINILKLKMRQHKYGSDRCIDSIQIKYNTNIRQIVCGNLSAGKIKSYEDASGKVKITLNVDTQVPFDSPDDFIEFQIVVTAFKECDDLDKEFECKTNNIKSCIQKQYTNDSIVNCIEPNCLDEPLLGCFSSSVYVSDTSDDSSSNENIVQIFLSAITSLILTMLTCGAFIWIIYRIKRCLSPRPATTTTITTSTTTRVRRRRHRTNNDPSTSHQDNQSPTAPPKDDLPPSYSDLFPEDNVRVKIDTEDT